MRSRKNSSVSSSQIHQWALQWLLEARLLKDHGWLCTATVVWNVVLRASTRMISVFAACRDLAHAPSQQAVFNALQDGLPRTLPVLEKRLNWALTHSWPRRLRERSWPIAIDWHLVPYYGQPERSRNEIYYGQPRQGTTKFHAYATACIVQHGHRYTLALTWVRRHETTVRALQRLLAGIREIGLKIRRLLLDRAFFNVPVTPLSDAGGVPRTPAQEEPPPDRFALDPTSKGGVVQTHAEERQTNGDDLGVRGLSHASEPQRSKTRAAKTSLRCLAGEGFSDPDPRGLPQTFWHRIELSANASGADLHLYKKPPLATGFYRHRPDRTKSLGLDSRGDSGGRPRGPKGTPPRQVALQTPSRLDRSSCRRHTS